LPLRLYHLLGQFPKMRAQMTNLVAHAASNNNPIAASLTNAGLPAIILLASL
jgi:hypothetical protein